MTTDREILVIAALTVMGLAVVIMDLFFWRAI